MQACNQAKAKNRQGKQNPFSPYPQEKCKFRVSRCHFFVKQIAFVDFFDKLLCYFVKKCLVTLKLQTKQSQSRRILCKIQLGVVFLYFFHFSAHSRKWFFMRQPENHWITENNALHSSRRGWQNPFGHTLRLIQLLTIWYLFDT